MTIKATVIEALSSGPITAQNIERNTGLKRSQVFSALSKMMISGHVSSRRRTIERNLDSHKGVTITEYSLVN